MEHALTNERYLEAQGRKRSFDSYRPRAGGAARPSGPWSVDRRRCPPRPYRRWVVSVRCSW